MNKTGNLMKIGSFANSEILPVGAEVLKNTELELMSNSSLINEVRRGETILLEGSMISHIIFLVSGLVKEFVHLSEDKEQILQIIKHHRYLGLPFVFGSKVNHYSYTALVDCRICYMDAGVFNHIMKQNGEFAHHVLVTMSKDSISNFNRLIRQTHKKIYGRVADALLYFSAQVFESTSFEIPFSRKEFADFIGLSRESTTRVLVKFKEERLISVKAKKVIINDINMLEQISSKG